MPFPFRQYLTSAVGWTIVSIIALEVLSPLPAHAASLSPETGVRAIGYYVRDQLVAVVIDGVDDAYKPNITVGPGVTDRVIGTGPLSGFASVTRRMKRAELDQDGVRALLFSPPDSTHARIARQFGIIGPQIITIESPAEGGSEGGGGEGGSGGAGAGGSGQ